MQMKLLYCNNCNDVFAVSLKKKKCNCGLSSAQLINSTIFYTGNLAKPIDMPADYFIRQNKDINAVSKKSHIKIVSEDDKHFCTRVIEYLNDKAGTYYPAKYPSPATTSILQRKADYDCIIEDFFSVIDRKVKQWKGTDFEIYLRPSTLFNRTKFGNYIGEHGKQTTEKTRFSKFSSTIQAAAQNISGSSSPDARPGHNE